MNCKHWKQLPQRLLPRKSSKPSKYRFLPKKFRITNKGNIKRES